MSDAPEKIYAAPPWNDERWESGTGEWDVSEAWAAEPLVEYIRADIAATTIAKLTEALEKVLYEYYAVVLAEAEPDTLTAAVVKARTALAQTKENKK